MLTSAFGMLEIIKQSHSKLRRSS